MDVLQHLSDTALFRRSGISAPRTQQHVRPSASGQQRLDRQTQWAEATGSSPRSPTVPRPRNGTSHIGSHRTGRCPCASCGRVSRIQTPFRAFMHAGLGLVPSAGLSPAPITRKARTFRCEWHGPHDRRERHDVQEKPVRREPTCKVAACTDIGYLALHIYIYISH